MPVEEGEYYQAIEETFVSHRGDPLFLSNADWDLARQWRQAGIPLRVVLRGIADAVDSHAHSWGRKRKIASLRYCAMEVERARERWHRALGPGQDEAPRIEAALRSVADRLRLASLGGGGSQAIARSLAVGILARLGSQSPMEELDRWLAQGEERLLAALDEEEGSQAALAAVVEAEKGLAPYQGRMPDRVLEQIREDAVTRIRLAAHGLPRLSLFHIGEGLPWGEESR